ncbi:MAG: BrnT family toxin [Rickettsiales bacterium]|nr:BrnT family toxin [Rickettsiales bacterium]
MIESNEKYSWDPAKRETNIKTRELDFVEMADYIFADPNVVVKHDDRIDYSEPRLLAYGLVDGTRLCLCWTPRGDKVHLITIFKVNKKQWSECYGKND